MGDIRGLGDIGDLGEPLYTEGEVRFLLSLTRGEAIDLDASQPDSCAHLTDDVIPAGDAGEDHGLMTIARWHDVHSARRRVVTHQADQAVLQAAAWGLNQREVAQATHLSQATVHRKLRASMGDLLRELGEAHEAPKRQRARDSLERGMTTVMEAAHEAAWVWRNPHIQGRR